MEKSHKSKKAKSKTDSCIFCNYAIEKPSSKNLVLYQGAKAYVVMNRFPYSNGHLMVIPKRHISELDKLTAMEHKELGVLLSHAYSALKTIMNCDGVNIGMNLGEAAGAGIADHLHYHALPRWEGDHNFMPTVAQARVIPEHMTRTYKKLKKYFDKL